MTALPLNDLIETLPLDLTQWYKRSMVLAVLVSCAIHAIFLVMKKPEKPIEPKQLKAPLAVVLVNSQSQVAPVNPKRLAQHNLNGGGQQEALATASTTSPMVPGIGEKLNFLQEEQQRLLSSLRDDGSQNKKTTQGKTAVEKEYTDPLEAELAKRMELESQRPRKAILTSTSAKSVIYAEYYNAMRNKVEAYGTTYFPRAQGKPLYGSVIISVSIDRDGKITTKPRVERSSGNAELDRQTIAIIQASAPFGKFSAGMRSQLDVIEWIASFAFIKGGSETQLELKMTTPNP